MKFEKTDEDIGRDNSTRYFTPTRSFTNAKNFQQSIGF
jgi:hypothetical protein